MKKNKTAFWVKTSGWSGLIVGAGILEMYKMTANITFMITLGIVIIFSAFLLATADTPRWENPKWIMKVMIFCLIFASLIQTVFLWFAYRSAKRRNKI